MTAGNGKVCCSYRCIGSQSRFLCAQPFFEHPIAQHPATAAKHIFVMLPRIAASVPPKSQATAAAAPAPGGDAAGTDGREGTNVALGQQINQWPRAKARSICSLVELKKRAAASHCKRQCYALIPGACCRCGRQGHSRHARPRSRAYCQLRSGRGRNPLLPNKRRLFRIPFPAPSS